jgi:hypothetical protein
LGGMNTNDQQTSNTLMKTCASQFYHGVNLFH